MQHAHYVMDAGDTVIVHRPRKPRAVFRPLSKVTVLKGHKQKYWSLDSVASMQAFFHLQKERMTNAIRAAQDSKWLFEL